MSAGQRGPSRGGSGSNEPASTSSGTGSNGSATVGWEASWVSAGVGAPASALARWSDRLLQAPAAKRAAARPPRTKRTDREGAPASGRQRRPWAARAGETPTLHADRRMRHARARAARAVLDIEAWPTSFGVHVPTRRYGR